MAWPSLVHRLDSSEASGDDSNLSCQPSVQTLDLNLHFTIECAPSHDLTNYLNLPAQVTLHTLLLWCVPHHSMDQGLVKGNRLLAQHTMALATSVRSWETILDPVSQTHIVFILYL